MKTKLSNLPDKFLQKVVSYLPLNYRFIVLQLNRRYYTITLPLIYNNVTTFTALLSKEESHKSLDSKGLFATKLAKVGHLVRFASSFLYRNCTADVDLYPNIKGLKQVITDKRLIEKLAAESRDQMLKLDALSLVLKTKNYDLVPFTFIFNNLRALDLSGNFTSLEFLEDVSNFNLIQFKLMSKQIHVSVFLNIKLAFPRLKHMFLSGELIGSEQEFQFVPIMDTVETLNLIVLQGLTQYPLQFILNRELWPNRKHLSINLECLTFFNYNLFNIPILEIDALTINYNRELIPAEPFKFKLIKILKLKFNPGSGTISFNLILKSMPNLQELDILGTLSMFSANPHSNLQHLSMGIIVTCNYSMLRALSQLTGLRYLDLKFSDPKDPFKDIEKTCQEKYIMPKLQRLTVNHANRPLIEWFKKNSPGIIACKMFEERTFEERFDLVDKNACQIYPEDELNLFNPNGYLKTIKPIW